MGISGGLGLAVVGCAYLVVASLGASGNLVRNGAVGIRTRATTASDQAWEAAHRVVTPLLRTLGKVWLILAVALVISGLIWRQEDPSVVTVLLFAVGYGAVLLSAIPVVIRANAAASAVSEKKD